MLAGTAGGYLYLQHRDTGTAPAGAQAAASGAPARNTACPSPRGTETDAARLKGPRSAPRDVRVDIYNAGAAPGSAQTVLAWLQNEKDVPKASQLGEADTQQPLTTLEYSPDQADAARELADLMGLPGTALKPGRSETNSQGLPAIVLKLGPDFRRAGVPVPAPAKTSGDCVD